MTMHIFAQFLRNIEALERLELATNGRILSLRSSPAALHTSQAFGYQDPLGLLISSCARIGFLPKHSGSPKTSPQCNDTLALPASQAAAFSNPQ